VVFDTFPDLSSGMFIIDHFELRDNEGEPIPIDGEAVRVLASDGLAS